MDVRIVLLEVVTILNTLPKYSEQCDCVISESPPNCRQITGDGIQGVCYKKYSNVGCAMITCEDGNIINVECNHNTGTQYEWRPSDFKCSTSTTTLTTTIQTTATPSANTQTNTQQSQTTLVGPSQSTQTTGYAEVKGHDMNIAVIVSVPVCIVFLSVIVVIIVVIMRRQTARRKGTEGIKPMSRGAINNNSYHDSSVNGNMVPMHHMAPTAIDNGYVDIVDGQLTPVDTSDDNYNTINLPNESPNTYGTLKPVTEPFVDNTYSHMNNARVDMGTMYSHIGVGDRAASQPAPNNDNTYSHIGTRGKYTKPEPKAVDKNDLYSHTNKQSGLPTMKPKTVTADVTYSHIGKEVNPHHKRSVDVCDTTYNTLGATPNAVLQNKPKMQHGKAEEDPEYNHLTSNVQTSSTNNTQTYPSYRQNTVQGTANSNNYDQVVEANEYNRNTGDKYETIDHAKPNSGNGKPNHSFHVIDGDSEDNTAQPNTDGDQTNHQYFVLEKHGKEYGTTNSVQTNTNNESSKQSFFVVDGDNEDNSAHIDEDQTNHQYFTLEKHEKE